jgi:hypothetical protein
LQQTGVCVDQGVVLSLFRQLFAHA